MGAFRVESAMFFGILSITINLTEEWELSDPTNYGRSVKLDGVTVDTYACGSELMGISGKTLDGIGTMCHEYSHCLGLPDFYARLTQLLE